MCDQLNASVLGCYGGPRVTPTLDALAAAKQRTGTVPADQSASVR